MPNILTNLLQRRGQEYGESRSALRYIVPEGTDGVAYGRSLDTGALAAEAEACACGLAILGVEPAAMNGLSKVMARRALKVGMRRNLEYHRLGLKAPWWLEAQYKFFDKKVFGKVRYCHYNTGVRGSEGICSKKHIQFSSLDDLVQNSEVRRFIAERIERLKKGFAGFEKIKRFTLLPREFTIEGGELTNMLKIRRPVINSLYAAQIEAMYA